MRFEDKVVWVTGASGGLGEALARAFHADGAHVVLSARRETELQRVAADLTNSPGECFVLPLDLARPDSFAAAAERVLQRFGRVDVLVNNAGLTQRALAVETDMAVTRALFEVNFFGPLALAKSVLPAMTARQAGRIVVVSSIAAKFATPLRSGYNASKAALERVFDAFRAETWTGGVGVTTIVLGSVRTDISINALTGDGGAYGRMNRIQAEGMDADRAAARILDAVVRGRDEVTIAPPWQRWLIWRARFLPRLSRRAMRLAPRNTAPKA